MILKWILNTGAVMSDIYDIIVSYRILKKQYYTSKFKGILW